MSGLLMVAAIMGVAAVTAVVLEALTLTAWLHERRLRYAAERAAHRHYRTADLAASKLAAAIARRTYRPRRGAR